MDIEIEAKFADIVPEEMRAKLKKVGATLVQKETLMKRKVYEHPTNKQNDWFRVRDEGGRLTMSYKKLNDRNLHGTQEISYEVPDFEQACRFLEGAQLRFVSYQETKRETWKFKECEVTIDTWPWIPTFLEIEGSSEKAVKSVVSGLDLDWKKAKHGSVENIYLSHYDVTEEEVDDWPEIRFTPVPDWLEAMRRN